MKKLLLTIAIITCCIVSTTANEIQKLKDAITSQLISDNPNTALVESLAQKYFPNGVETDQCLMEVVAYALPADREIEGLLQSMTNNESWSDIDYLSPARSAWVGREHIKRILKIARCYRSPKSKFFNDPKVLESLTRAITYWCDGGFECTNWWYNAIGVPKEFAPVLLLLEGKISDELMSRSIKILDPAEREMTGQNKVWLNGVTFIKGLLLGDTAILRRTSEAIKSELKISNDEGIQYDYSFHQHGAMQQFGNYGLAFASSQSYWMRVLSGTSYDFTADQKQIMRMYMTRGINSTVWNGFMDVSSCGRQLFVNSQAGKAASLLISNLNMMDVDSDSAAEYQQYIDRNYTTPETNNLQGNIVFPISKYTIHRTSDFMFSVKMFSTRIIGGESTNNENLKGYHLADGATMIYRTGREYDNIFAVWDGKYMPGTTVEQNDKPLPIIEGANYLNDSDFAGGVSDGMYGVSALEYRRDGVSANKSWFFIDDVVVCLGNSIKSDSGSPLVTTLNQCKYQQGAQTLDKGVVSQIKMGERYNAQRVMCDGVGYETLDGSTIDFIARQQRGEWHDVALFLPKGEVTADVFTAQLHHKEGVEGQYSYIVRGSIEQSEFFDSKRKDNFKVVQNDANATVVEIADKGIVMAIFWRATQIKTKSLGRITATAPAMAILSKGEECKIYDPLECGAKIEW